MMAHAGARFDTENPHHWIEEAICGAYTVYCIRAASTSSEEWLRSGAKHYLADCIDKEYSSDVSITSEWYQTNAERLGQGGLTDRIKPLSRLIADELSEGEFISNNVALIGTPLNPAISDYLDAWELRCATGKTVPRLLRERLGIA